MMPGPPPLFILLIMLSFVHILPHAHEAAAPLAGPSQLSVLPASSRSSSSSSSSSPSLELSESVAETTTATTHAPAPSPTTTSTPANSTSIFTEKRSVGFLVCALPGSFYLFFGCRFLMLTVFMGGFCIAAVLFYLVSPLVFAHTSFCCGDDGTELGHALVSALIGIVGGLVACKILRFGLCVLGAAFGLLIALVLLCTPLQDLSFFDSHSAYAIWYTCFMLSGAALSCLARTWFVLLVTSIGGSFAVFLGIDYFATTSFGQQVLYVLEESYRQILTALGASGLADRLENDSNVTTPGILMFCGWVLLAGLGGMVQYRLFVRKGGSKEFPIVRAGGKRDRQQDREGLLEGEERYELRVSS